MYKNNRYKRLYGILFGVLCAMGVSTSTQTESGKVTESKPVSQSEIVRSFDAKKEQKEGLFAYLKKAAHTAGTTALAFKKEIAQAACAVVVAYGLYNCAIKKDAVPTDDDDECETKKNKDANYEYEMSHEAEGESGEDEVKRAADDRHSGDGSDESSDDEEQHGHSYYLRGRHRKGGNREGLFSRLFGRRGHSSRPADYPRSHYPTR